MAGAGTTLFTAGSVLTAAQVNTYLMDQTVMRFASTAARDAAFGGVGEPTLAEGMLCYIDADDKVYVNIDGTSGGWTEIGFAAELAVSTKTADYTLALNDKYSVVQMNIGGANTLTIPTNAAVPFNVGTQIFVTQLGAGATTIAGDTGVTAYPTGTLTLANRYSTALLLKVATNTWYVSAITNGNIAVSALDIDGATDIGAGIADADLIIVDDGGAGTNRKAAATRITDYVFSKVSGDLTIASNGTATLSNAVTYDQTILAARIFR